MKNNEENFKNSTEAKSLFVLKIITMSFAILAFVVITTAMLTHWIFELNRTIKDSKTKIAKATARINKFRKNRIKHILKQRKEQLKEERKNRKTINHLNKIKSKNKDCEQKFFSLPDESKKFIENANTINDNLNDSDSDIDNIDDIDIDDDLDFELTKIILDDMYDSDDNNDDSNSDDDDEESDNYI